MFLTMTENIGSKQQKNVTFECDSCDKPVTFGVYPMFWQTNGKVWGVDQQLQRNALDKYG